MGKVKSQSNTTLAAKQALSAVKNGSVHKKKHPKFKNTPMGKVALIEKTKQQGKNAGNQQKKFEQQKHMSPQKSPNKNELKGHQNQKENKQSFKNKNSPQKNTSPDKKASGNDAKSPKKDIQLIINTEDSDEDINEGIDIKEEISIKEEDDVSDEEGSEDEDIPDILGNSLADDSDEDDEDFTDDEDDSEEEVAENKGVKMFRGLKPKEKDIPNGVKKSNEDDSNTSASITEDDDMSDDSEDDDEDEEANNSAPGLKDLLGNSIAEDEDDEDFIGDDDDDEDEDEGDDDEDDEESEESEEEEEEKGTALKVLLDSTIPDDEDDEDFNAAEEDDEDDDISDEDEEEEEENNTSPVKTKKSVTNKKAQVKDEEAPEKKSRIELTPEEKLEVDKKTIFVGNVPKDITRLQLYKEFKKFGRIANLRLRGIVPAKPSMSKRLAAIKNKIHPKVKSIIAFIIYDSEESVKKALTMNGKIFHGNYLRVDTVGNKDKKQHDKKKSVFLGNLSFTADDNMIWEHFKECGEIESVHIVRDSKTGLSRGLGYVNFKTREAASLALELNDTIIKNRPVRVLPYQAHDANKKEGAGKKRSSEQNVAKHSSKKFKKDGKAGSAKEHTDGNTQQSPRQEKKSFQGQKADIKTKKRKSSFEKKKKILAAKLTAKPKKPENK